MTFHVARRLIAVAVLTLAGPAIAADFPKPVEADFVAKSFTFHTGEVMPEVKLHYLTVGNPSGEPVLVLHGTAGAGANMLTASYAGELFGAGQPLDAAKYFIILPDGLGTGASAKPSDGLKTKFPKYNYADMVQAQYRLVTEGLGIKHLRLVTGNSMGGMHAWVWGTMYPGFMDALVPMASQPTQMSGRNWMLRRMLVETIRSDPGFNGGNYTVQPKTLGLAGTFFSIATSGGTLAWQKQAATSDAGDKIVDGMLGAPARGDANDVIYQWEASRDYDPSPGLDKITAKVLAINAADDERNPPETGLTEAAVKRIPNARLLVIPASTETRGHGTTGNAKFYAKDLAAFMATAPRTGS